MAFTDYDDSPTRHTFPLYTSPRVRHKSTYTVGICAMDKKAHSKQMQQLLGHLAATGDFIPVYFGDSVLLEQDISTWPVCDFVIAFYSDQFPLHKAIQYQQLRAPIALNDLALQQVLFDRRLVLALLDACHVPTPRRLVASRDGGPCVLDERLCNKLNVFYGLDVGMARDEPESVVIRVDEESISVNGQVLRMPFVEKPVNGDDHDVRVYYDKARGGGVRHLFRKVGDCCSRYFPGYQDVRTEGSYVYEEFIDADDAEDVKVYAVGNAYAHAEARKSPVVDGVVKRCTDGREARHAIPLSTAEMEFAHRISRAFGQMVCGFDLLRRNHGQQSYVMDVNGWSFVKGNDDYYEKCSQVLRDVCYRAIRRGRVLHEEGYSSSDETILDSVYD